MEQNRFDFRSLSPALPNLWLLLVERLINDDDDDDDEGLPSSFLSRPVCSHYLVMRHTRTRIRLNI